MFRKKPKPVAAPAPAVVPAAVAGEPDMQGLGRVLWQKKTKIVGFTVIAAAAAFVVVNGITPRYRSESRILLEQRESVFTRAEADKNLNDRTTIDPEAVTSQIQVVLSRDLARQVIKTAQLDEIQEFDSTIDGVSLTRRVMVMLGMARDPNSMTKEERTQEAYYDRIRVNSVEKSRVIVIDFDSSNPELAAKVANTIADTYLSLQQAAKQDQTRAAGSWLSVEIDKLRAKVEEDEAKIEDYRAKANLFVGTNNTSLPNQQLTEINSQISAARGQKADLEARARQLREQLRSGQSLESSDIANSESMRRLIEQRTALRSQLAEQSSTLLDQHPRIKELRAQIAEVDHQIKVEGERLARQLDNDAKVAGDRLQSLMASLDQVKKLASQSNEQDVQLRALEREAKTQRDLLENYLAKYREASARDNINAAPPEARIISRAAAAVEPTYPKKGPIVLIAAFAAFALSAGFTVTGALLAAPAYNYGYTPATYGAPAYPQPAPMAPAAPVATAPPLPRMKSPPLAPAAPAGAGLGLAPPLPVTSIELIAASLRQAGEAGRRVAVLGSTRNAGTTYAAISLARNLANEASVVLVDLAFGAPNLSVISTDPEAPGMAELIAGTASFGDIITRDQFSQVHLVATGQVVGNEAALAASPMVATAIEALARSYDHVVIDIGSVADVAIEYFAGLATRAVLVAGDPAGPAAKAAAQRLSVSGFANVMVVAGAAEQATV